VATCWLVFDLTATGLVCNDLSTERHELVGRLRPRCVVLADQAMELEAEIGGLNGHLVCDSQDGGQCVKRVACG
jgi:hypothetical protein